MSVDTVRRAQIYTAKIYAVFIFLLAARFMWVAWIRGNIVAVIVLVIALILILWAYHLAKCKPAALKTASVICLLIALSIPLTAVSPFGDGDGWAEVNKPISFFLKLMWITPMEFFLLGSAYLLNLRFPATGEQHITP